jgi:prophage tail gpP-like protein
MPKISELCEVEAAGQIYDKWTAVMVTMDHTEPGFTFSLQAVEPTSGSGANFGALQLKPGDAVSINLAGKLAMKGNIHIRQASYDAQRHAVQLDGGSKSLDSLHSNVPLKGGEFRNYSFQAIGNKVLQDYDFNLKIENAPKGADKKFKEVNVLPGDTVFSFLSRLARFRGLWLTSNADGDLVAGRLADNPPMAATLQEGQNILTCTCKLDDLAGSMRIDTIGSQRGDDQTSDEKARKSAAYVEGDGFKRNFYRVVLAEMPGDADDMRLRTDHRNDAVWGGWIEAMVTVQGWLKPNGELWKIREAVKIKSPMALLDHQLAVARAVFMQDDSGTKTQLFLKRFEALGSITPPGIQGGEGGILPPAEKQKDAQALD